MASGFPYVSIDKFGSLNLNKNQLNLDPGQLIQNENYLWNNNQQLYERGGGAKLSNAPSAGNPLFGLGNYKNSSSSEFLVTVQGTDAYYYNSGWNALSLTLTSNKKMRFESAGFGANRALYGFNGNEGVVKITGTTPAGSIVGSSPTTCVMGILHKNRLFAIDTNDTVYYTDVGAFDTWNTGSNTFQVAPGIEGDVQSLAVWGDALFIFKERGVYVLPNASDASSAWTILRSDAITGTTSPDTVKRTRIGVCYLSTDNFVRVISPNVTFSSGEYTLGGSGSPLISREIQDNLDETLDADSKTSATAVVNDDNYILSYQTVSNTGTYNDRMFAANTNLLKKVDGEKTSQPYWTLITGLDFDFIINQSVTGVDVLYGIKGANGETHTAFDNSTHNDNSTAIVSRAAIAWVTPGGEGLIKKLKKFRLNATVEDWAITCIFNSYKDGFLPSIGQGTNLEFRPSAGAAKLGSFTLGTDTLGDAGIANQDFRLGLRGRYFTAQFKNENVDEFTRINSFLIYFRPIKQR